MSYVFKTDKLLNNSKFTKVSQNSKIFPSDSSHLSFPRFNFEHQKTFEIKRKFLKKELKNALKNKRNTNKFIGNCAGFRGFLSGISSSRSEDKLFSMLDVGEKFYSKGVKMPFEHNKMIMKKYEEALERKVREEVVRMEIKRIMRIKGIKRI